MTATRMIRCLIGWHVWYAARLDSDRRLIMRCINCGKENAV